MDHKITITAHPGYEVWWFSYLNGAQEFQKGIIGNVLGWVITDDFHPFPITDRGNDLLCPEAWRIYVGRHEVSGFWGRVLMIRAPSGEFYQPVAQEEFGEDQEGAYLTGEDDVFDVLEKATIDEKNKYIGEDFAPRRSRRLG